MVKNAGSDSEVVLSKQPCLKCGNEDSVKVYSDGHSYCFRGCGYIPGDGTAVASSAPTSRAPMELQSILDSAQSVALTRRGITKATCEKFGYLVRTNPAGEYEQLAVYCDPMGNPEGIKVRNMGADGTGKSFYWIGKHSDTLYGRWLWKSGGKMLVITEGEVDCLSASQVQDNRWPVVSLVDGAGPQSANCIRKNLDWIISFDKVVIVTDMDAPGRQAAQEIAMLLPPGKAFIAHLDAKDPNELLKAGKGKSIVDAIWGAQPYRPDGIVNAKELTADCLEAPAWGTPYPWEFMTKWTYGIHPGQVIVLGGPTGGGKSDFTAAIQACLITGKTTYGLEFPPEPVAVFSWESGPAGTKKMIAGKIARRRFHIPDDPMWTPRELVETLRFMDEDCAPLFINNHYGAAEWDLVRDTIRFLARAEGVKRFFLDPLTALSDTADEEQKELKRIMAESAGVAEEIGGAIFINSHLTTPEGKPHEEGGRVKSKDLKGSRSIMFWAHNIFGLERDQQAETEEERMTTTVRELKCRLVGIAANNTQRMRYDTIAGTLDVVHDDTVPAPAMLQAVNLQEDTSCPASPVQESPPKRSRSSKAKPT